MEREMTLDTSAVSVLVVSDFPVFRDRIDLILEEAPDIAIASCMDDVAELSQRAGEIAPDVVLLDVDLPWESICREVTALAQRGIPSLVIADPMDSTRTIELLRSGGSGILGRRTAPELLLKSLRAVSAGELWISRHVTFDVIRLLRGLERDLQIQNRQTESGTSATSPVQLDSVSPILPEEGNTFGLTPRELEVTAAVVDGQTNKDIAESFGISVSTVKHHLTSIFDKLGVYNRVELVLFALNRALVRNAVEKASPDIRTTA